MIIIFQSAESITAQQNALDILQILLKSEGVEVNAEDLAGGQTPLYLAAYSGNRRAVEMLLEHGADPDVEVDGQKVGDVIRENVKGLDLDAYVGKVRARPIKQRLFDAVETNDVNALNKYAESNAVVNWNEDNGAVTLLQFAASKGHEKVVHLLLKQDGVNPNLTVPDHPSGLPMNTIPSLHQAARRGASVEVVDLLLTFGADPNAVWDGHTAHAMACLYGNIPVADHLAGKGFATIRVNEPTPFLCINLQLDMMTHILGFWQIATLSTRKQQ